MHLPDGGKKGADTPSSSRSLTLTCLNDKKALHMANLYVIGNGFDLHHKLPTKYVDFRDHSAREIEELEQYFGISPDDDDMWRDFEANLANFDGEMFFDDTCHNDQCESFGEGQGIADDIGEQADSLVDKIQESFCAWVESIDVSAAHPSFRFDNDDIFMNFNYTKTLESVYKIDSRRINHIHGGSASGSELIFGHGVAPEKEEPEQDENGDSNRTMYTDAENAAKYPLHAFRKDTKSIIDQNSAFFESIENVHRIVVLGHSLSDVDLPYFCELATRAKQAIWIISYYLDSEYGRLESALHMLGIKHDKIKLIKASTLPGSLEGLL